MKMSVIYVILAKKCKSLQKALAVETSAVGLTFKFCLIPNVE
jgi:hypothetical protein